MQIELERIYERLEALEVIHTDTQARVGQKETREIAVTLALPVRTARILRLIYTNSAMTSLRSFTNTAIGFGPTNWTRKKLDDSRVPRLRDFAFFSRLTVPSCLQDTTALTQKPQPSA